MPAYVTLPGTSGNYFSTPDVNLLDADTAHTYQSRGVMSAGSVVDDPDSWSGRMNKVVYGSSGTSYPTVAIPQGLSPATQYSCSALFKTDSWSNITSVQLAILWRDSGDGNISYTYGDVASSPTEAVRATITATSPALTDDAAVFWIVVRSGAADCYFSDHVFRTGADASFVPSLRIVNDLEIEWKVALDDYTPTATNTILDCLNSNDGYRIRHTTGDLIEIAYGNGSSTRAQTSSATGLTDGEAHVIKVTVDQSTGAVVYYIDGVQHDTDTMTTGAGSPSINALVVGANAAASANWTDGDLYYVIVRDGIDGPIVARFDADDWVGI